MHNHPGQSRHHLQWASVHSLIQCLIVACLHHVHHATYPSPSSVLNHESQSTWCGIMESWDEGSHWAHGGVSGTLFMVWHIFGTRTIKQYPMKLKLPQHTGLLITHVVWTSIYSLWLKQAETTWEMAWRLPALIWRPGPVRPHSQTRFALVDSDVGIRVPDLYWETSLRDEERLDWASSVPYLTSENISNLGNRPATWSPKYLFFHN